MTDENKEVSPEQEQATVEEADAPGDERCAPEELISEGEAEPVQETTEVADVSQESVVEEGPTPLRHSGEGGDPEGQPAVMDPSLGAADVVEIVLDPTAAPTQENQTSDDASPLTQSERDIDQVIGELLGEPQASEQEEDGRQKTEDNAVVQDPSSVLRPPSSEAGPPAPQLVPTVESVLEAVLFAADEPITESKLAGIVETTAKQVRESIESLNAKYAAENHAFRIEQIAGGYQMLTLNVYNQWLKKMLRARSDNKLSPAAMETLAIVAYKQPIIRADIEAIRGVAVGDGLRNLMYKGLVKIVGRAEILGHPMLYGTTKKFLEVFGLNSLKDLPKAEELKNPDRG